MRTLEDHIVSGDQAVQLKIEVTDEPGAGGANHSYEITGFDAVNQPGLMQLDHVDRLHVIDRLRSFQAGPFSCRENAIALTHFEEGLMWLQRRTVARIKRGVEGTNVK